MMRRELLLFLFWLCLVSNNINVTGLRLNFGVTRFLKRICNAGESRSLSCKKWLWQTAGSKHSDVTLSGHIKVYQDRVRSTDRYKETSRLFRRTVFTKDDWVKLRSSRRLFHNFHTMFFSGVIRGLWIELVTVTSVSLFVFGMNYLARVGLLMPFVPPTHNIFFSLPALPFQLSSQALGLLLVFRTNSAYARWCDARQRWELIQKHCLSIARQGLAYLEPTTRDEFVRRVLSLAHIFKSHFRTDAGEENVLSAKLQQLLGAREATRLTQTIHPQQRPVQALADLSHMVRCSAALDGSTRSRFDHHLDELTGALVSCEGLRRSPVPLVYTRHTGRFLGLWALLLPLALAREFGGGFALVPASALMTLLLFGIEELGLQIEEPFSILPLEDAVETVEAAVRGMVRCDRAPTAAAGQEDGGVFGGERRPMRIGEDAAEI